MPNTTNFNWATPADTDLVKDGAAAIRTLGNGIDTSFLDLKGGTTDQVLAKNSNTDLDFKWVAQDDSNAIQNALLTTTGDTIYASAASTPARLGLGTAGQVLTVNSGATAPEWAAPASAAANYTLLNAGGTALSGTQETVISGISGKESIAIFIDGASSASASSQIWIRINGLSTTVYNTHGFSVSNPTSYAKGFLAVGGGTNDNKIDLAYMSDSASSSVRGYIMFEGCNSAGEKVFHSAGGATSPFSSVDSFAFSLGGYVTAAAITSVTVRSSTGNFDAGTIFVYAA